MTDKSKISRSIGFAPVPVRRSHYDWTPDNKALLTVLAPLNRVVPAEYDGVIQREIIANKKTIWCNLGRTELIIRAGD